MFDNFYTHPKDPATGKVVDVARRFHFLQQRLESVSKVHLFDVQFFCARWLYAHANSCTHACTVLTAWRRPNFYDGREEMNGYRRQWRTTMKSRRRYRT